MHLNGCVRYLTHDSPAHHYVRNAKTHGADQVAKIAGSMARFGWTVPVLVGADGEVIAGHGRILAAAQLGLTEAPVIVLVASALATLDGLEVRWRSFTSARATRTALRLMVEPTPSPIPIAAQSVVTA